MKRIVLTLILIAAALTSAQPAAAADEVHPEIAAALAGVEGGVAIGYYEAYWADLDLTMTVPDPRLRSVGTCSTGSFCAYGGTGLTGTKLSWGTCATVTPPPGFATASIANARSAGSVVQARNGTTILASASSGAWANVFGTVTTLRCLS